MGLATLAEKAKKLSESFFYQVFEDFREF